MLKCQRARMSTESPGPSGTGSVNQAIVLSTRSAAVGAVALSAVHELAGAMRVNRAIQKRSIVMPPVTGTVSSCGAVARKRFCARLSAIVRSVSGDRLRYRSKPSARSVAAAGSIAACSAYFALCTQ